MENVENLEQIKKAAWQDGYDAALEKIRMVFKMKEIGMPDCKIVERTDLPPVIVHHLLGEE